MKLKYTLLSLLVIMILASCKKTSFLEPKDTVSLDIETVFTDSVRTMAYLSNLYSEIGYNIDPKTAGTRGGWYSEATDESEHRYPSSAGWALQLNSASYGSSFYNHASLDWSFLYARIRAANIFISEVERSPLSAGMKARTTAEARFLKIFYYHYLLKEFGGVPIVGDKVFGLDEPSDIPRDTYEDCVEFFVDELDAAAAVLPLNFIGSLDYGRVTKGACLALKSRILLHAASPLFNGENVAKGNPELEKLLGYSDYSDVRWTRAMEGANAVIQMNQYSLYTDNTTKPGYGFYRVFLMRVNNEFILSRMIESGTELERQLLMPSRGGNFYLQYPLQQLVDKFPMDNGKPISEDSRYVDLTDAMYKNRDPRFYYTIIYNEKPWYDTQTKALGPVFTYNNTIALNGTLTKNTTRDGLGLISTNLSTTTGYYRAKMLDENNAVANRTGNKVYPLIRYAEILLNYAEAANELGQTQAAMDKIKEIRTRAGIIAGTDGRYGLPANPTKDQARLIIRNERDIELAFEEHRFYDTRRWKQGASFDNWTGQGMEINRKQLPGSPARYEYTYARIPVRVRKFEERVYFMPIGVSELALNKLLVQNPGW